MNQSRGTGAGRSEMPEKGRVPRPGAAYVFYGILPAILV
ncbi:hypothetical protein ABIE27_002301 [Paenibacillus sp. 4624]|nr:hypothetical protein [Paenibacillus intestini]